MFSKFGEEIMTPLKDLNRKIKKHYDIAYKQKVFIDIRNAMHYAWLLKKNLYARLYDKYTVFTQVVHMALSVKTFCLQAIS